MVIFNSYVKLPEGISANVLIISNHISRYFKHLGENQKKFPLLDVILDTAKEHAWRLPRCPQLSQKNVEYSRKFVQHLAAVNLDIDIKQGSTMQVKFSRTQHPAGLPWSNLDWATLLPAPSAPGKGGAMAGNSISTSVLDAEDSRPLANLDFEDGRARRWSGWTV